ncbi:MAG TPA: transcription antitermination factor NusB [Clostridiaceae bacterium]|nr:transcription antitermination factor NusB [Clostridiaceae bacterium]
MRKRTREIAMELLYQSTMNEKSVEELMDDYFEDNHEDLREDTDLPYLETILKGVINHKEELDALIESHLVKWKLSRISKINLSILRLSAFELLHMEDIPPNVSIFEAVELSKKYSDDTAGSFINGVLDKIGKNQEGSKG